ncbi:MAG: hypothetical protein KIT81_04410 [Alphaproteobacteria bacterium]|nr:hypothetical protein [Alphaproteobacteria bacterium]
MHHVPIRPTSITELQPAERLLVWTFRAWLGDPALRQHIWREYRRHFDRPAALDAIDAFSGTIEALRRNARRPILYHQPCCPCLGADEVTLLIAAAALQAGNTDMAARVSLWLVRRPGVAPLLQSLGRYADGLATYDLLLPERVGPAVARPAGAMPELSLVH